MAGTQFATMRDVLATLEMGKISVEAVPGFRVRLAGCGLRVASCGLKGGGHGDDQEV